MPEWLEKIRARFRPPVVPEPLRLTLEQEIRNARDRLPGVNYETAQLMAKGRVLYREVTQMLSEQNTTVEELFQTNHRLAYRWKLFHIQGKAALFLRDQIVSQIDSFTNECREYIADHKYSNEIDQSFRKEYESKLSKLFWRVEPDERKLFKELALTIDTSVNANSSETLQNFFARLHIAQTDSQSIVQLINLPASDLYNSEAEKYFIEEKRETPVVIVESNQPESVEGDLVESQPVEQDVKMQNDDKPVRDTVFISYSRRDARWLEMVKTHLKPFERDGRIKRWDDTEIKSGQEWKTEIEKAIASARVVVLLVSPEFLASDFIANNELPPLLVAAETEGATILSVIINDCNYALAGNISKYQAINLPEKPLAKMSSARRNEVFAKLTERILEILERN